MGQDLQDFYSLENNFIRYTWVVFYRFKSILLIENPPLMPNFSSKKHSFHPKSISTLIKRTK